MSSSSICSKFVIFIIGWVSLVFVIRHSNAQLTPTFYDNKCPNVSAIISNLLKHALKSDPRVGATILRVHFHDCFTEGCTGSILLDGTPEMESEKSALASTGMTRGYEVVDDMKAAVEKACPGVVFCADILAIASEAAVSLAGGPSWNVLLGRRDIRIANISAANAYIPSPFLSITEIISQFQAVGLDINDIGILSGAHTFGRVRCLVAQRRLYNYEGSGKPDPTLNTAYLDTLGQLCPKNRDPTFMIDCDPETPDTFDNQYYINLMSSKVIMQSDQAIYSTPGLPTVELVKKFRENQTAFFESFASSMIKMGNLKPLTGNKGEIRKHCSRVNDN